jgi:hypothetical protein
MRNRFLRRMRGAPLVVLVACACSWLAAAAAGAERYDDVSVSITAPPTEETSHGNTEYRVALTNHSAKKAHTGTLHLPADSFGEGDHIRRVVRTTSLAPSSQAVVSLFVPPLEINGGGLRVIIDGRTQRRPVSVPVRRSVSTAVPSRGYYYGGSDEYGSILVLTGRNVSAVAAAGLLGDGESGSRFGGAALQTAQAELDVEQWSTNWLAYSCYDGVLVTEKEMERVSADARSALWQWVECGGTLIVLGRAEVPAAWRSPLGGRDVDGGAATTHVGFGQCIEVDETASDTTLDKAASTVARSLRSSFQPLSRVLSVEDANDAFPVVEGLTSPVRGLMLLMLVFVVTIGPVNLLVLSKLKRRIWLLWTVPAISLLTCGAVTLYAAIAEGWTGRARTETLTILDQEAHRATTLGWTAFYCPVTPRSGLHFGGETELTPQVGPQSDYYYSYRERRSGRARDVDWTNDQHLASGWVSARVPAHFRIRKSEMRRERLTVTAAADGSLTAVNGLGVDVTSLWIADADGDIYRASAIAAGKQVALGKPVAGTTADGTPEKLRAAYTQDWLTSTRALVSSPANYLMPGTYIAVLDETPFLEDGLRRARREKCRSIVYGIIGEISEEGEGQ